MSQAKFIFEKQLSSLREIAKKEGCSFETLLCCVIKEPLAKIPRLEEAFGNDPNATEKKLIECYRVEFYEWLANRELETKNLNKEQIAIIVKLAKAYAKKVVSENAKKEAKARFEKDPKQLALKEIKKHYQSQQTQFKQRGYSAQFKREMGEKYPVITDIKTIERLITKLNKENKEIPR